MTVNFLHSRAELVSEDYIARKCADVQMCNASCGDLRAAFVITF